MPDPNWVEKLAKSKPASHWVQEYLDGTITQSELVTAFLPYLPATDWEPALREHNLQYLIPLARDTADFIQRGEGFNVGGNCP